jgi:hypothetical protein
MPGNLKVVTLRVTLTPMKKNLLLLGSAAAMVLGPQAAIAGGSKGSLGVGAEYQLGDALIPGPYSSLGGLSMNYDLGQFHVGGFLGMADRGEDDDTDIAIGGRFYYHVHSTAMSDFGIGGQIGIGMFGDRSPLSDKDVSVVLIEPGFQIRAFVTSNVVSFQPSNHHADENGC